MGLGPLHDLAELLPVINILELHQFDGRASDDETVVFFVTDLVEGAVEGKQMILGRMGGFVGFGLHKVDFNLKRSVGQAAQDLSLGHDLERHEVEQADAQRTDILGERTVLGHNKYIFAFQHSACRKAVGNFDRHKQAPVFFLPFIITNPVQRDKGKSNGADGFPSAP